VIGAIGKFEHASLQINFGALDVREAQKSMRLFAAEVMPAFADAVPRRGSRYRVRRRDDASGTGPYRTRCATSLRRVRESRAESRAD
jgi:hypothetical protein